MCFRTFLARLCVRQVHVEIVAQAREGLLREIRIIMVVSFDERVRKTTRETVKERYRKREPMLYGLSASTHSIQDGALNNERDRCCRPLIERALSFQELSRAENIPQQIAHTRTNDKKTRQDKYVRRVLRKAAVKTTWVESLGQDSSMCWTHIENFNLCEKFDKYRF